MWFLPSPNSRMSCTKCDPSMLTYLYGRNVFTFMLVLHESQKYLMLSSNANFQERYTVLVLMGLSLYTSQTAFPSMHTVSVVALVDVSICATGHFHFLNKLSAIWIFENNQTISSPRSDINKIISTLISDATQKVSSSVSKITKKN